MAVSKMSSSFYHLLHQHLNEVGELFFFLKLDIHRKIKASNEKRIHEIRYLFQIKNNDKKKEKRKIISDFSLNY